MTERMMNMSVNNEYTIEELKAQYRTAAENQRKLKQQIEQKEKEKQKLEEAQLAKEKQARKQEVDNAIANAIKLLDAYMDDFGFYSYETDKISMHSKFWNYVY